MKIVIMGCGRVGARLANTLDAEGHDVAIIDLNQESFARLALTYRGRTVVGTGIDEDVLRSAGTDEADAFVAVTSSDNPNIMASQIAKHIFNVPEVLCRIYDPVREGAYHLLGLDTVCPTTMVANVMREHILSTAGRTS
ncbi:MAG: TrkA family potassium uptake protein [Chloroflexi bacterium]|nr:TrkA family potassium uptake protein [Chloroflexota bacterium]